MANAVLEPIAVAVDRSDTSYFGFCAQRFAAAGYTPARNGLAKQKREGRRAVPTKNHPTSFSIEESKNN
jgi:hypothetical protein